MLTVAQDQYNLADRHGQRGGIPLGDRNRQRGSMERVADCSLRRYRTQMPGLDGDMVPHFPPSALAIVSR